MRDAYSQLTSMKSLYRVTKMATSLIIVFLGVILKV